MSEWGCANTPDHRTKAHLSQETGAKIGLGSRAQQYSLGSIMGKWPSGKLGLGPLDPHRGTGNPPRKAGGQQWPVPRAQDQPVSGSPDLIRAQRAPTQALGGVKPTRAPRLNGAPRRAIFRTSGGSTLRLPGQMQRLASIRAKLEGFLHGGRFE